MKRNLGISRNKFQVLQNLKSNLVRRKNIFKYIGKQDELSQNDGHNNSNNLLSATTKNSSNSIDTNDHNPTIQIYQDAKNHLESVTEYKKKMNAEIKLRMGSFKESQIKIYDENINKYSSKAVEHLLKSQKILVGIRNIKGSNQIEQKFYRNMQKSLALQVRQSSRSLRLQQKEYYQRIKLYETNTANLAIQLKQQDRQKFKDQYQDVICQTQAGDLQKNKQINDLVKSINQLNVIEQGSLIDRIDYNIEETYQHIEKGVEHLQGANQKVQSPCARKCMCILIIAILVMAIVVGFKLSSSQTK